MKLCFCYSALGVMSHKVYCFCNSTLEQKSLLSSATAIPLLGNAFAKFGFKRNSFPKFGFHNSTLIDKCLHGVPLLQFCSREVLLPQFCCRGNILVKFCFCSNRVCLNEVLTPLFHSRGKCLKNFCFHISALGEMFSQSSLPQFRSGGNVFAKICFYRLYKTYINRKTYYNLPNSAF